MTWTRQNPGCDFIFGEKKSERRVFLLDSVLWFWRFPFLGEESVAGTGFLLNYSLQKQMSRTSACVCWLQGMTATFIPNERFTQESPSPRMNLMCFPFYQKNHSFGRSKEEHYAYRSILLGNCIHYGQGGNVWVQKPNKNDNKFTSDTPRHQGYTNEGIATAGISKSFLVIKNNQKKFQGFWGEQSGKLMFK